MLHVMQEIKITSDTLNEAKVLADVLGKLKNSITGGGGNIYGFIGEIIVAGEVFGP